jgi:parallel beta-helix repeat protein
VTLEFDMSEGFVVSEPHWTFENLSIRGVCAQHSSCEHAFHVVSRATHFVSRNNAVTDFNAHFKINGSEGNFPDHGLIEGNTLSNSSVRDTESSVTPIDLVAASHWVVRGNWISDFAKAGSDRVSYGAFAKGGGADNRFEQNIVLCEHFLRGAPGQRVGISLGGGGSGKEYCRDTRCITEQDGGVIRSNLIMGCSDDGIYLNRAATSQVYHNTLIDTGGISVRFVESSAELEGNLVDGAIRSRDGGALHATDNIQTLMTRQYLGSHPVRGLYRDPSGLDLSWAATPPRRQRAGVVPSDLCGSERPRPPTYGAFEDFSKCLR